MSVEFTVNGKRFWIDEFADGFAWVSETGEGNAHPEVWQAQQEALDYMRRDGSESRDHYSTEAL